MTIHERQIRVLNLFNHLSLATFKGSVPEDEKDERLKDVGHLDPSTVFSCFYPPHLEEATKLYEIFYLAKDFDDFIHLAEQARTFVNATLFAFAAEVAILHRPDCKGLSVPPIQEVFAERFIPAAALIKAYIESSTHPPGDETDIVVDVVETGNILDPEYKLAYYREDIAVNAHHWHWHIVYPSTWNPDFFHKTKDRKGELFYYMHQQMCARYDSERLSNGLHPVVPFHNLHEPLSGYAPHLAHIGSGRHYSPRADGMVLHDLKEVSVLDMIRWRERIVEAVNLGKIVDDHQKEIPLDAEHGINIIGELIESSHESKNRDYYGSLHNWGHVMISNIHDPDGRFQETPGAMSDTATSLRDPIFYRLHRFMDNVFQEYKESLPHYTKEELNFPDIEVTDIGIVATIHNVIHTFFRDDELELSHCLMFATAGSVRARYHHLDHETYTYTIHVQNNSSTTKDATVRIFLAPKYDELGNEIDLSHQRRLFIEMDKFRTELHPGKNTIVRGSTDSSVTLLHQYSFKELEHGEDITEDRTEFCSCGWPHHLLVPKGNSKGMAFHLFAMVTDWDKDKVDSEHKEHFCNDAVSYCGVMDDKYPDKKAMGFPFDRAIDVDHHDFLTSNMALQEITIRFSD